MNSDVWHKRWWLSPVIVAGCIEKGSKTVIYTYMEYTINGSVQIIAIVTYRPSLDLYSSWNGWENIDTNARKCS